MRNISRKLSVRTQSGKTVTVGVTVYGSIDKSSRNNTTGKSTWNISNVATEIIHSCDDGWALSQDEKNEVEKLIGERVDAESWNFDE